MKIEMILTNRFDPDWRVYKEALYLLSKGHSVEILCWDRENEYPEKREEIIQGIKIKRFFVYSQYGSGIKQIPKLFQFAKLCKKYIKENNVQYDVMHCHDLDGIIVGHHITDKTKRLVFDMHEFYEGNGYEKIAKIIRRVVNFYQSKSWKIIHVNDQQVIPMKEKNKKKLVYLPNYPEQAKFKDFTHIESDILQVNYTGYVRYLVPLTNLIRAVKGLEKVQVCINGSGKILEELKEEAKECSNVKITGAYQHTDVAKFYAESDLTYIVYNKGDKNDETALPTKFFESIITQTPIMVSKNSLMEQKTKEYDIGFCVDGTKETEIREVLQELIKNKQVLKQKSKNMEKIKNSFTWEEVVKSLDKIYQAKDGGKE